MNKLVSSALAGVLAMAAASPGHTTSPIYDRCMTQAGGVTSAMRDCASDEYARQDKTLNAEYKAARARLPPDAQTRLKLAERAWLKRRAAQCRAGTDDGTAALLDADGCVLTMTDKRIAELKALGPR